MKTKMTTKELLDGLPGLSPAEKEARFGATSDPAAQDLGTRGWAHGQSVMKDLAARGTIRRRDEDVTMRGNSTRRAR